MAPATRISATPRCDDLACLMSPQKRKRSAKAQKKTGRFLCVFAGFCVFAVIGICEILVLAPGISVPAHSSLSIKRRPGPRELPLDGRAHARRRGWLVAAADGRFLNRRGRLGV